MGEFGPNSLFHIILISRWVHFDVEQVRHISAQLSETFHPPVNFLFGLKSLRYMRPGRFLWLHQRLQLPHLREEKRKRRRGPASLTQELSFISLRHTFHVTREKLFKGEDGACCYRGDRGVTRRQQPSVSPIFFRGRVRLRLRVKTGSVTAARLG